MIHDTHRPSEPADCTVSHLQRREIQAPVAAGLIRAYADVLGLERALEIAGHAIRADAAAAGREMSERMGGGTLAALEQLVRELWGAEEAMTVRLLEVTGRTLHF